jgi:hypothetical protein
MAYHDYTEAAFYIDLATGGKISSQKPLDEYKTLQFAQDGSLDCGDTDPSDPNLSVHCEIISPILNNLSELKLLYDNIISKTCNYSNSSTGFHVNISIIDENKIPFKFNPLFELELFKNWYKFEEAHYEEYRGKEGSFYAKRLGNYVKDNSLVNTLYAKKSEDSSIKDTSSLISEEEVLSDYGLKELMFMEKSNEKTHSIYKKSDSILECRIFPSKNDEAILLDYTKKALDIVKNSMNYYIKNYTVLSDLYNNIFKIYKEKYRKFNFIEYSGSYKDYKNLINYYYERSLENLIRNYVTKIEVQEIEHTTFLLIFDNVKLVKKEKIVKGLLEGEHHYYREKGIKSEMDIIYDPTNDFLEIKNFEGRTIYM